MMNLTRSSFSLILVMGSTDSWSQGQERSRSQAKEVTESCQVIDSNMVIKGQSNLEQN